MHRIPSAISLQEVSDPIGISSGILVHNCRYTLIANPTAQAKSILKSTLLHPSRDTEEDKEI